MKRYISLLLAILLLSTLTISALSADTAAGKEEVVYGVLNSDGSVQQVYVVNSFQGGSIADYGDYSTVDNLTSTEQLNQSGDKITVVTTADRFYYQGTLEDKNLPWNIAVTYQLDGNALEASKLAGQSGDLLMTIAVTKNSGIDPVFFDSFMLQISLTLDAEKCGDIVSPGATLANAGKNKVVTHTVLPGKESEITVSAKVRDFSMSGLEIAALPFSMAIELPDIGGFTEELNALPQAISALNEGAKKLYDGVSNMDAGARKLADGASGFAYGLSQLSKNAGELQSASEQIQNALSAISGSLAGGEGNFSVGDLMALPGGLQKLSGGLNELAGGMQSLKSGYAAAYKALDSAISAIPETTVDPAGLYAAVQGDEALTANLDRLMAYYAAAKTVQGTYGAAREAFASVESGLEVMTGSVNSMSAALTETGKGIEQALNGTDFLVQMQQLQAGLSQLSENYAEFHKGLEEYMKGVSGLSEGYGGLQSGIGSLAAGLGELNVGTKSLYEGTGRLNQETSDLPNIIQAEIDELLKDYDTSEYVPQSFVSEKNTEVSSVQFVLKTPPIERKETPAPAATASENKGLWQKLLELFKS